jgi:hypothetical protein
MTDMDDQIVGSEMGSPLKIYGDGMDGSLIKV